VLAYKIETDSAQTITLTGAVVDCYRVAPTTNSTGAGKAIDITGEAGPAGTVSTRFYVRPQGEAWTTDDRRLEDAGVDTFDVSQVSYPITFTGPSMLAPGFPPTVSQIKAIRPIDLGVEVIGTLDDSHLPPETVVETELARSTGEGVISGLLVSESAPTAMTVEVAAGEALIAAGRFEPSAVTLTIPTADGTDPRIDIICLSDAGVPTGPSEDSNCEGTPDPTPTAPATPAGYLLLAEVSVPASDTTIEAAQITDYRVMISNMISMVQALDNREAVHEGDSTQHFTGTEKADGLLTGSQKDGLVLGDITSLHKHPGSGASSGHPAGEHMTLETMAYAMDLADRLKAVMRMQGVIAGENASAMAFSMDMFEVLTSLGPGALPYSAGVVAANTTHDFTLAVSEVLVTEVLVVSASAGSFDYTIQFFEDSARATTAYEALNITSGTYQDRVLWEFFGADQIYGRLINNNATDDLTVADVTLSYRR